MLGNISTQRKEKEYMSFLDYTHLLSSTPMMWITTLLTFGVILVNGWTDAPNSIATCVTTRAMRPRLAITMSAIFNFLGVFIMTLIAPKVVETVSNIVDLGTDSNIASIALAASMVAIIVWAVLAWAFGFPSSQSHSLVAGLTGASVALNGNFSGVSGAEWLKVLIGLVGSLLLGFILGFIITKIIHIVFKRVNYHRANVLFNGGQIFAAAASSFMHGAQDGQKFIGVFILGITLCQGDMEVTATTAPMWLLLVCAIIMALGTSMGGMKIIKSVGMDMAKLEKYQGFASDLASTAGLLVCTLTGLPVSTTHIKSTSIMGVGAAKRVKSVNWSVAKDMVLSWIFTFPGCGIIGYLMTKLFLLIF